MDEEERVSRIRISQGCMAGLLVTALLVVSNPPARAQDVPWGKLPNIEADKLTADVKNRSTRVMREENCYWECSSTIFQCVTAGIPSKTSLRLAGFIVREVIRGKPDKEIKQDLVDRAKSVHPFATATINTENASCLGPADAAVTVAAFSDFECPFCRLVSPILRNLASKLPKVRYCFKVFPVKGHGSQAVETSKMAVAADALGKFWEFHDVMYKNFENHSDSDIQGYVTGLGLEWDKFRKKTQDEHTTKVVSASKKEGLKLGVKATPTLYVNGKEYFGEKSEVEILDRLEEELDLLVH
jgi:protein-disulfide isomerase